MSDGPALHSADIDAVLLHPALPRDDGARRLVGEIDLTRGGWTAATFDLPRGVRYEVEVVRLDGGTEPVADASCPAPEGAPWPGGPLGAPLVAVGRAVQRVQAGLGLRTEEGVPRFALNLPRDVEAPVPARVFVFAQ